MIGEYYQVSKLHHKEYSPTARLFEVFRGCGVGQVVMVKSFALVCDGERDRFAPVVRCADYFYCFGRIRAVAMYDSIISSLRQGYEYVSIRIICYIIFGTDILYEGLNLRYIIGV